MDVSRGYDAGQQEHDHEHAADLGAGILELDGLQEDDDQRKCDVQVDMLLCREDGIVGGQQMVQAHHDCHNRGSPVHEDFQLASVLDRVGFGHARSTHLSKDEGRLTGVWRRPVERALNVPQGLKSDYSP